MAWRNIVLATTGIVSQSEVTNPELFNYMQSQLPISTQLPNYIDFVGTPRADLTTGKLCGDNSNYIEITNSGGAEGFWNFNFYYNGAQILQLQSSGLNGNDKLTFCAGVNDETHTAWFKMFKQGALTDRLIVVTAGTDTPYAPYQTEIYNILTGAEYHQYTWQSVPAISGKNGILSLSTLKSGSINNGNPVSDATLNAFEILIEASNVGKLVLDTDIDESQVVIRYNIPNNTYQYVKLVYKENYAPESISDGVAIDIQQTDTQLVLDDITTTGTYYFKIFTDNGNSNTVVLNYVGIIPIIIKIERVW